jgi:hypothetical protein
MFDDIRAVIRQKLEVEDGIKLRSSFERSLHQPLRLMISRGGGLIATASSPEEGGVPIVGSNSRRTAGVTCGPLQGAIGKEPGSCR